MSEKNYEKKDAPNPSEQKPRDDQRQKVANAIGPLAVKNGK